MNFLIKGSNFVEKEGLLKVVGFGEKNLKYIGFDILKIKEGESFELFKKSCEIAIVILKGYCKVRAANQNFTKSIKRSNIFDENATAIYIPLNEKVIIDATKDTEIGVCYSKTNIQKELFIIEPDQIKSRTVGKDNYTRTVRDIIDIKSDTDKMLIGETLSENGNWSSFPPHKHDRDFPRIESKFEEIYHFRFQPTQGFAFQNIYTEDEKINEVLSIKDYDSVVIPKGYHPVVGCPGYKVYYLWILGGLKRDTYKLFEEEKHSWINS
jgi:5-deoxy-glucuronate isomerase